MLWSSAIVDSAWLPAERTRSAAGTSCSVGSAPLSALGVGIGPSGRSTPLSRVYSVCASSWHMAVFFSVMSSCSSSCGCRFASFILCCGYRKPNNRSESTRGYASSLSFRFSIVSCHQSRVAHVVRCPHVCQIAASKLSISGSQRFPQRYSARAKRGANPMI